jgi:hypothetical protein
MALYSPEEWATLRRLCTRANSGAALERITPAGARIYEILHHPEAFTVQTIAAAEHIKGRHYLLAPDQRLPNDFVLIVGRSDPDTVDLFTFLTLSNFRVSFHGEDGRDVRGGVRDSRAEGRDCTGVGGCY